MNDYIKDLREILRRIRRLVLDSDDLPIEHARKLMDLFFLFSDEVLKGRA